MAHDTTTTLDDQRLTEILANEWAMLIGDRGANLRAHSALLYQGSFTGMPALSKKCPLIGWDGFDILATVGEGGAISLTNLTDDHVDVSVGKFGKGYGISDYAALWTRSAIINNPAAAAADAMKSRDATLTSLIAALADDWSQDAGATGTAMTADKFYAAIALLEAAYIGEGASFIAQLTSSHYSEFRDDLRSETGVLHLLQSTAEAQRIKTGNFRGSYGGVDITVSSRLPTASTDTVSQMFGTGGVYWADAAPQPGPAVDGLMIDNVLVEWARTSNTGQDDLYISTFLGVSKAQDGCGVGITSAT